MPTEARLPRRPALDRWPLLRHLPQKLGAVVAAVALWFAASGDRQATVERTFDAPLLVRGRTAEQDVTGLPGTISVTLAGARDRLESLRPGTVEAYVNLSGVAVGSFVAPVMIVPPADTRVARSSPREVAGRLDVVESASLPVRAAVTGLPANAVVRVRAVPDAVTVTGARSRLAEAAYALVIAGPESTTARVTAVDADGSPVEGLNLRPASVRLMREERAALAERTLPIALARAPAGLTYRRFTLSVDQVRVVGPPNVVEGLASIVARPATAVQAGTVRVQLRLELPAGVTSLDPPPTATLVVATSD